MSLTTAQKLAWSLACTLKVIVVLIETGSGYTVMPSDEFDGDVEQVVREYDPWGA